MRLKGEIYALFSIFCLALALVLAPTSSTPLWLGNSYCTQRGGTGYNRAYKGLKAPHKALIRLRNQKLSTSTAGGLQGSPWSLLWLLGGSQGPWGSPAVVVDSFWFPFEAFIIYNL